MIKPNTQDLESLVNSVVEFFTKQNLTFTAHNIVMGLRNLVGPDVNIVREEVRDMVHRTYATQPSWFRGYTPVTETMNGELVRVYRAKSTKKNNDNIVHMSNTQVKNNTSPSNSTRILAKEVRAAGLKPGDRTFVYRTKSGQLVLSKTAVPNSRRYTVDQYNNIKVYV